MIVTDSLINFTQDNNIYISRKEKGITKSAESRSKLAEGDINQHKHIEITLQELIIAARCSYITPNHTQLLT